MRTRLPLHNVSVLLPVSGHVTSMQAQPQAVWSAPFAFYILYVALLRQTRAPKSTKVGSHRTVKTFVFLCRSSETNRAVWKIPEISPVNANGTGCLRAKFDLAEGPSQPSAVAVQFLCEGSTLSGLDFELAGSSYRVSLVKKRFLTGSCARLLVSPVNMLAYQYKHCSFRTHI